MKNASHNIEGRPTCLLQHFLKSSLSSSWPDQEQKGGEWQVFPGTHGTEVTGRGQGNVS